MLNPTKRPPLVLRSIALFEAVKGLLALAATCGLLSLRHTDLHVATDAFLLRHGINPERHYTRLFIESVAKATDHHVGQLVALGLAYALIRLAEGYGLWRGRHWAEWFAVISAGLYLPFELQHLAHHATRLNAGVIFFNVLIVLYLAKLLIQQRTQRHAAAQSNGDKGSAHGQKRGWRKDSSPDPRSFKFRALGGGRAEAPAGLLKGAGGDRAKPEK